MMQDHVDLKKIKFGAQLFHFMEINKQINVYFRKVSEAALTNNSK